MSGPFVVTVPAAYSAGYLAAFALVVAACADCAMLRPGSLCLSHVCLDCGGPAHPADNLVPCS